MKEPIYSREALLKSQRFAGYQRDFLGVILTRPAYTIPEAVKAVESYFKGGKG